MTAHLLGVVLMYIAAVAGTGFAVLAVAAAIGAGRGNKTPVKPRQDGEPEIRFSPDTERAIAQNLNLFGGVHPDGHGFHGGAR